MSAITQLSAALVGRYEIEHEIGAGGMATVYRARDLRHDRHVALKLLNPELGAVIGAERFLSEIRVTAKLQHPNLLPLFDSGEVNGLLFYVMPLVGGETLRALLERERQLPIDKAVSIARDVASALDYAHRHGVVHRDIKPENILLHEGSAVVADFGIALAVTAAGGQRLTQTGLSLGTPQYMSPEQAMGEREIDARSDIYSLGAVTYEMLVGEPPFTGHSAQATLAKVITERPPLASVARDTVPMPVAQAVQRALAKLPADRFTTAAEFATALAAVDHGPARPAAPGTARDASGRAARTATFFVLALAAGAAGWALRARTGRPIGTRPVHFAFALGSTWKGYAYVAISPDGQRIAQAVRDSSGISRIFARDLASTSVAEIEGAAGGSYPTFSPDGEWLLFVRMGTVRRVPSRGGPVTDVAKNVAFQPSWGDDGHIVYTSSTTRGLWRIPSGGGSSEQLTAPDSARGEYAHWYPEVLPGSHAVIFNNYATPLERSRIEAYDFATKQRRVLVENAVFGRYAASGHLLFVRNNALFAIPFDADDLSVRGVAAPVLEDVAWTPSDGLAGVAVASNGTLVYLKASAWTPSDRVVWVGRDGKEIPVFSDTGRFFDPRIAPGGRSIAIIRRTPLQELWLYDAHREMLQRIARLPGGVYSILWSPSGRDLVYARETPRLDLFRIPVDGSAPERLLLATPWDKFPMSFSPDGRALAFNESDPLTRIKIGPVDSLRAARPWAGSGTPAGHAVFSPDGRWIAYAEEEGDRREVFVRASDGSGARHLVSRGGGTEPLWSRGGREIVFRRGVAVLAATFDPHGGDVGLPAVLFSGPYAPGDNNTRGWDGMADGSRFLMVRPAQRVGDPAVNVVLGWFAELKRKVPR